MKPRLTHGKRLPLCNDMKTKQAASIIGRKGGRATGPAKARPPEHYSAISRAYWTKRRAFMNTFLAMSDREKLQLFKQHGLTGANQTATHLWVHIK